MSIHAMSDDEFADFDNDELGMSPETRAEWIEAGRLELSDPDDEDNYDEVCEPFDDDDIPEYAFDDFEASDDI